ncbi:MAG: hypothetical protein V4653_14445 [Pseudomonadota bacterium]
MSGNIALLFFLAAGISAALTARFIHASTPGVAQVVSTQLRQIGRGPVHLTGITLVTPDGRRLSTTWASEFYRAPHTQVAVRYRTEPTVVIRDADRLWSWTWFFLSLGGLWVAMATISWLCHRRRRKRNPTAMQG